MRALLVQFARPYVQDIFMHLEDAGTTYETAIEGLNNHIEPKKNIVFKRYVFRHTFCHKTSQTCLHM